MEDAREDDAGVTLERHQNQASASPVSRTFRKEIFSSLTTDIVYYKSGLF
jgi:hypothetical protein